MDNTTQPTGLQIGPIRLDKTPDGKLQAQHVKLAQPVDIDEGQLLRWLLRHIRDEVTA